MADESERTMVLMALGTGLRRRELFALKWKDIDFAAEHISVTRSIVNQVVGACKTEASQKPVPLHSALAQALLAWRRQTSYRKREDWRSLPKEILEVGETQLTAIIHPSSSLRLVCSQLTNWPEESGGRTTLDKIAARCREMHDPPKSGRYMQSGVYIEDQLLDNLVAPERQRQKREIVRSIDRVCELIRAGRA